MTAPAGFLAALELAAKHSAQAEDEFRRDWAERLKALERERAFAHRRLNFMRAIGDAVGKTESEEIARGNRGNAGKARLVGRKRSANAGAFALRAGRATDVRQPGADH